MSPAIQLQSIYQTPVHLNIPMFRYGEAIRQFTVKQLQKLLMQAVKTHGKKKNSA